MFWKCLITIVYNFIVFWACTSKHEYQILATYNTKEKRYITRIENQKLSLKNVLTLNMRLYNGIYSAGSSKRTILNKGKGEKRTIKMWTLQFCLSIISSQQYYAFLSTQQKKTSFIIFIYCMYIVNSYKKDQ